MQNCTPDAACTREFNTPAISYHQQTLLSRIDFHKLRILSWDTLKRFYSGMKC